jgi:hypothetical protein
MVLSPHACNELKLLQMIFFLATNVSLSWFYVRQYIPFFQEDTVLNGGGSTGSFLFASLPATKSLEERSY